ncbi:PAS domain S-box-containing protein [Mesorhizobium albiziae]|uniref:histidine kinase n=1 Tax=Neomesorhizobium albiziae TaxID=335020 RepID=A0A1I4B6D4_9HYPH|nr:ATP-binding protein [Mesorhizobium albiziae]GLS34317.1 ATPase [Mesorhizobium albiziae]SFK63571.1 PAS domain S-box-containing protein [Mesorhizobium albiziae]
MPSATYSFIDIAVLDDVRQRFAAGDALAILSTDLEDVIWANGPGAAVFGYPDIEAIIGASTRLGLVARRQIMATAGYPDIGRDKGLMVRLATGMTSQAVSFLASAITLPDGERAILLAAPAGKTASFSEQERAERTIGGLNEPGHFAALVGADGTVIASPDGFGQLGIATDTLAGLVAEVKRESDRLVKRLIPAARGRLPVGFARLTDDPALHLLVVVDEVQDETEPRGIAIEARTEEREPQAPSSPAETVRPTPGNAKPDERWYFNTDRTPAGDSAPLAIAQDNGASATVAAPAAAFQRETGPVRFVWRTDANGNFSTISPEFARAVGEPAADIVGRKFGDVAMIFGFDPGGEIGGLLERRDTWSGRSVLWPVSGTDLRIPVDLAALPVYGRDRNFEGFRGFGVARGGDAVADPEKLGLALVRGPMTTAPTSGGIEPASPDGSEILQRSSEDGKPDPFKGEVPALTIVPKQERRFSDKVIRLAEHRTPANDKGLTPVERNAFREIGDRLKKDSTTGAEKAPAANATETTSITAATSETGKTPDIAAETRTPEAPAAVAGETPAPVIAEAVPPQPASARSLETGTAATDHPPAETSAYEAPAERELVTDGIAQAPAPEAPASAAQPAAEAAEEPETVVAHPDDGTSAKRIAPELRTTGFLPSAFSTGGEAGERAPTDVSILSKLPVPVLIHSGDVLHYANDEFFALTGYETVEQLADCGGLDTLFGEPYEEDADASGDHKMRLLTRDGTEFPVEARLQSVPWSGGKALLLAFSRVHVAPPAEAVAEQPDKDQATELENRIAEMRAIVDTATDGVVLIAPDGSIRSISRAAEALFGFDNNDVTGKPFASLFAIESQRAAQDYLAGLSEHGVASVLNDGREVIGREAQGRFIPLFMTIGKLPADSGYCAVVRDVTQWKRAEEELTQARAQAERASSQKTDFLARVSHEIRTPLNAIIGFSELMIDEKFGPVGNDRYRDYLRDINRSGNHVLDLVNDLLDISKIEAGEQEMAYEAVSLNETLSETVAMMQPQANRERVIIRSSFASRLPEVVADLRSVRQIALNLLSNAVRYTQAGGQVIVSTAYEPSGDIVMRVRDTGIGMSPAEIEQALKPFKQINALKRGRNDGTGLGLPLTKAMVEANRAKFSIVSTPGEGTLVEITFPSTRVLAD